ncbi:MAG: hypothetical protein ACR2LY_06565 [Thermoleophilaceae bacterium]
MAAVSALAAGGCGGEEPPRASAPADAERGAREPPAPPGADGTGREDGRAPPGEEPPPRGTEDQPGGAGDEEPIRTEAVLRGRDGRLAPRLVRVPPFISVRLELRSADGRTYAARVAGRTLRATGSRPDAVTLEGLPTGDRYVVRATGGGSGRSVIEAVAEPGP